MIAITVEDEEYITKFKDYEPSTSGADAGDAAVKESPAPPKKEVVEQPVSSPEPKTSKPTAAPPAEDRIFSSPLARKLAEEHNVSCHKCID